jgi:hypothetical protein
VVVEEDLALGKVVPEDIILDVALYIPWGYDAFPASAVDAYVELRLDCESDNFAILLSGVADKQKVLARNGIDDFVIVNLRIGKLEKRTHRRTNLSLKESTVLLRGHENVVIEVVLLERYFVGMTYIPHDVYVGRSGLIYAQAAQNKHKVVVRCVPVVPLPKQVDADAMAAFGKSFLQR